MLHPALGHSLETTALHPITPPFAIRPFATALNIMGAVTAHAASAAVWGFESPAVFPSLSLGLLEQIRLILTTLTNW